MEKRPWDMIICGSVLIIGFLLVDPFRRIDLYAHKKGEISYQGLTIEYYYIPGSWGRNRRWDQSILLKSKIKDKNFYCSIIVQDFRTYVLNLLGTKSVKTKDSEFDKYFFIRINRSNLSKNILDERNRAELLNRLPCWPEFIFQGGVVKYYKEIKYDFYTELPDELSLFKKIVDVYLAGG